VIRSLSLVASMAFALGASTVPALAADAPLHLPSTPKTVVRGVIAADRTPVLKIRDGQTVAIDTVSHGGLTEDPVKFFGDAGIPKNQVLQDVIDIAAIPRTSGFGGHVLTGPIYVEGAEPGDMLEVRIHKITPRVPYGVNNPGPGGVDPTLVAERSSKIIKFDMARKVGRYPSGIEVPLVPFMGIMAVAPSPQVGQVGSRAPGNFGGNLDFAALKDGATLYLPVLAPGALFYTGDSHAGQGDGEVDGNAIEASMTATLQFIVHKGAGKAMTYPSAEDKDNFYALGMDKDLNLALKNAVHEAVLFLQSKGMAADDAYSVASVAVHFGIAEAVDENLVVYGRIPKSVLPAKTRYWTEK
jgi:acetamidase/formamidase